VASAMNTDAPAERSIRRSCAAFSLVELMVAVLIIVAVVGAVFKLTAQSLFIFERSRDIVRVSQILQYQMETVRSTAVNTLASQVGAGAQTIKVDSSGVPTSGTAAVPHGWEAFTLQQTVETVDTGYYKVTLNASWTDRRGEPRTDQYVTWICDGGLNDFFN